MSVTITVEDGTGTASAANSYVSVEDYRAYATQRGLDISGGGDDMDDDVAGAHLILAMDYLEEMTGRYVGYRVLPGLQPLCWPRYYCPTDLATDDYSGGVETVGVAPQIIKAQCELAAYVGAGNELFPTENAPQIVEEVIGPLTTKYSERNGATSGVYLPKIKSILAPVLNSGGGLVAYRA